MVANKPARLAMGVVGRNLPVATVALAAALATSPSPASSLQAQNFFDPTARASFDSIIARLDSVPVDELPTAHFLNRGYLPGERLEETAEVDLAGFVPGNYVVTLVDASGALTSKIFTVER